MLDERGKKVWELLICDPERKFEYSEYFPSSKINSGELKRAIGKLLAMPGAVKPDKARFFRGQMQTIITKASPLSNREGGIGSAMDRRKPLSLARHALGGRKVWRGGLAVPRTRATCLWIGGSLPAAATPCHRGALCTTHVVCALSAVHRGGVGGPAGRLRHGPRCERQQGVLAPPPPSICASTTHTPLHTPRPRPTDTSH
eukprot:365319-Chlamydomonas_euryale.AAC.10